VSVRQLRSKAELALEIVRAARARGMRFAWVGVDGGGTVVNFVFGAVRCH
jgi:SRSO17 transposase